MPPFFQIDIPKRSSSCVHLGEHLLPGMEIYSLLLEGENHQFLRQDFCSSCWVKIQAEKLQKNNRGYWKTKIESKKETLSSPSSRLKRAINLLRQLQQKAQPNEAEIFVLCLFLAHARQLILRQEFQKDQFTYQIYEVRWQDEYLTVKMLNLSQEQTEIIQKSLADQLQALERSL